MEESEEYYAFIGNKRDTFMDTPMQELTKLKNEKLRTAATSNSQVKLKGKKYYVGEGKKRYLWLATRMGMREGCPWHRGCANI